MKSETPLSLVLGGVRTHNLLISGLTTKPSCLGARQEGSGLPKLCKVITLLWILYMRFCHPPHITSCWFISLHEGIACMYFAPVPFCHVVVNHTTLMFCCFLCQQEVSRCHRFTCYSPQTTLDSWLSLFSATVLHMGLYEMWPGYCTIFGRPLLY